MFYIIQQINLNFTLYLNKITRRKEDEQDERVGEGREDECAFLLIFFNIKRIYIVKELHPLPFAPFPSLPLIVFKRGDTIFLFSFSFFSSFPPI